MSSTMNPQKLKILVPVARASSRAIWEFDQAALAPGAISRKDKELMALAVAFTTQCPYCIGVHADRARDAGASEAEVAETVTVAAGLRPGAAITHGAHAIA